MRFISIMAPYRIRGITMSIRTAYKRAREYFLCLFTLSQNLLLISWKNKIVSSLVRRRDHLL
jgi:hypothetical protein